MGELFPHDIVQHIVSNIKPPRSELGKDKPCWMLESNGAFSVKSTWQYIRHREDKNRIFKWIWTKGVPFKMTFLMWSLWNYKIPIGDTLRR